LIQREICCKNQQKNGDASYFIDYADDMKTRRSMMDKKMFKAMVVEEQEGNRFLRRITSRSTDDLPAGDVLVRVIYSSLNYKDALSATGNKGVTRRYPHTPGIDAAGIVEESAVEAFRRGDEVIVTSYDLGMNTAGGFGQYIRVPAAWVVKQPAGLSLKDSMAFGTAGITAAMAVKNFEKMGVTPDRGEILVTGATGGVGSIAVSILAKLGYAVVAATGKSDQKDFLLSLGAKEVISREQASDPAAKPILKARWAGVVDPVGGNILATAIKSTNFGGVVSCCGNAGSNDLNTSVFPFILRGVSLLGVDSQNCPMDVRLQVWEKLSGAYKPENLERLYGEISLAELDAQIDSILKGKKQRRAVINLWPDA
jgi:acrylyl-CoA reductase (NADPH)